MEALAQHIEALFQISNEEATLFLAEFRKLSLSKNEVFVEEGTVCNKIGLIGKGLLMCAYNKEGEQVVEEFAFEKNFVTNYYSFITRTPSAKEIRCIEDTVLYVITRESLERLAGKYSFIERMARIMNERLFLSSHQRIQSLLLDTPAERYVKLVAQRQDLVQRIPQYLVAAYLNVKPETVSRIRKKISSSICY